MAAVDPTKTDNINNFTASGKAKSQADKASDSLFSNYDQFVKLLSVQLQNQDPTKPLETDQITSQIAQLSQVEQQVNSNKNLETLIGLYNQSQFSAFVGYIGKMVEASGNYTDLRDGQAIAVYNLADDTATNVTVTISDMDGNLVREMDGTKLAGRNQIIWDGKNNAGETMKEGTYTIAVKAKDAAGDEVKSATSSAGRVSSVETVDGVANIAMGDILVPLSEVISVREMPKQTASTQI